MYSKPYKRDADNNMESISLTVLLIITIILPITSTPYSSGQQAILGFLIYVPSSVLVLAITYAKGKRFQAKRQMTKKLQV